VNNYVEDDDSMFRFAYPQPFLRWFEITFCNIISILCLLFLLYHRHVVFATTIRALLVPGYHPDWHVGVRVSATRKLVGFITGIPVHVHVYDKEADMAEINFLCVHKKLRTQRLAPVLIKEVTRRVNLTGVWQVRLCSALL
jgi:glycylpeptide N-tetradecanoyltransferase